MSYLGGDLGDQACVLRLIPSFHPFSVEFTYLQSAGNHLFVLFIFTQWPFNLV